MSKIPNPPPDSIFAINLKALQPFLVDLPPLAMVGMRHEQDGWEGVRQEITDKQPKYGDRAGITATDFNRFVVLDDQYGQIEAQLPVVKKALEVVIESLSHVDNQRHKLATQFANVAESHAKLEGGEPALIIAYEKTIAYRSIIADKGVKTRKKNEGAQGAGGAGAGATGPAEVKAGVGATGGGVKAGEGISRIPNPPPDAIFAIDLNPLKAFLVDLPAGARRGMRTEQEGWNDVQQEVIGNQPKYGDRAGITATDFNRFVALNDQHKQILAQVPSLEKAVEVLTESLAHVDNQRHALVTQFANAAEAHAGAEGGDPTLITAYEKTIAYRSIIADKAVKARKKSEEAKSPAGG